MGEDLGGQRPNEWFPEGVACQAPEHFATEGTGCANGTQEEKDQSYHSG